jgi:hypothetical protein
MDSYFRGTHAASFAATQPLASVFSAIGSRGIGENTLATFTSGVAVAPHSSRAKTARSTRSAPQNYAALRSDGRF